MMQIQLEVQSSMKATVITGKVKIQVKRKTFVYISDYFDLIENRFLRVYSALSGMYNRQGMITFLCMKE